METRQIIAAGIVVALVCVGVGAFYILTQDDGQSTGTYSFSYTGMEPTGILIDENGKEIIRLSTWIGDDSDLYTAWTEDGQILDVKEERTEWLIFTLDFQAEPGTTINAEQIYFGTDGWVFGDEINPSDYYITPFMLYDGKIIHSNMTNTSVTTDSSGHAQMIVCILTDQHHDYPLIFSSDTSWTCNN